MMQKFSSIILNIFVLSLYSAKEISLNLNIINGEYGTLMKLYNSNSQRIQEQYVTFNLKERKTILFFDSLDNITPYHSYVLQDDEDFIIKVLEFNVGLLLNNDYTTRINIEGSNTTSIKYLVTGLSLALSMPNYNHSITHQLYNDKQITKLSFSFYPGKTNNKFLKQDGKLFFGEIPSHLIKNQPSFQCKIAESDYWACNASDIIIMKNNSRILKYPIGTTVMFTVNQGFTNAPKEFVNSLIENVFKELFEQKLCWLGRYNSNDGIVCSCKTHLSKFKGIKFAFVIDGVHYEKDVIDMFIQIGNIMVFEIVYTNSFWVTRFKWEIGGFFMQKYISNFDYEQKMITFYEINLNNDTNYLHVAILENIALLGCGTLLLIILK